MLTRSIGPVAADHCRLVQPAKNSASSRTLGSSLSIDVNSRFWRFGKLNLKEWDKDEGLPTCFKLGTGFNEL